MKIPSKIINDHIKTVEEEQGYKTTLKQRLWLKHYMATKNATEAAMQVYECKDRNSARVIGAENLAKLNFDELMDAIGLTDEYLLKHGQEGIEKPVKTVIVNGQTKLLPDYGTRHKYYDTALRLKKKLSNSLELTGKDGSPLQLQVVAGIGFLNPSKDYRTDDIIVEDANNNIPEQVETIAPSTGSDLVERQEVQSPDLA